MNKLTKKFIFLYDIINLPVIDALTGKKIGRIFDLAASLKEMYPKVTGLLMCNKKNKKIYLPWSSVKMLVEEKGVFIENFLAVTQDQLHPAENEILLKETFWDKQIVDIHGSKVVRINDLHLLREGLSLWVVHMDIGITGLLRRLGVSKVFEFIIKLVSSYEVEDKLISWKYVQPVDLVPNDWFS